MHSHKHCECTWLEFAQLRYTAVYSAALVHIHMHSHKHCECIWIIHAWLAPDTMTRCLCVLCQMAALHVEFAEDAFA